MATDPLSDMLTLMNAQTVMSGGLRAGGAWAVRFPPPEKIKLFAIVRGTCWFAFEGEDEPLHCGAGDVVLLSAKRPLLLASDLAVEPVDARGVFAERIDGIATHGDGDDFLLLGGHVQLDPTRGDLLYEVLPPLIHVRATAPESGALQWLLAQLVRELAAGRPGATLAAEQLTQLIFVQILRAHLATAVPAIGWLRAIADPKIAPALQLIHGDPARPWQLAELARATAMSRTTFALRFKSIAGIAPLAYLHQWRMRLAERSLRETTTPISTLARSLGYTSESAFSNAFKRTQGLAPKRYRTAALGPAGAESPEGAPTGTAAPISALDSLSNRVSTTSWTSLPL